jgi:hypothetical protein
MTERSTTVPTTRACENRTLRVWPCLLCIFCEGFEGAIDVIAFPDEGETVAGDLGFVVEWIDMSFDVVDFKHIVFCRWIALVVLCSLLLLLYLVYVFM